MDCTFVRSKVCCFVLINFYAMKFVLFLILMVVTGYYLFEDELGNKVCASDLMGVWKADDGAVIELKNDGTCRITSMNFSRVTSLECYNGKRVTITGKWNYMGYFKHIPLNHKNKLLLEVYDGKHKVNYHLKFHVRQSNFLLGEAAPNGIYMHMSGKERYEFRRPQLKGPSETKVVMNN